MDREEDCKWGYGLDDQIRADRLPDTEILPEGMKKVRREDPEYPGRLRNIPDPPKQLYYYGELPGEDEPSAAIIGARDCSEYGKYVAIELGRLLGQNGICVISGMARGIDGISQEAALSVGGRSYGVLGSGADVCYPRSNRGLYEQLKCRGGVLSEYAPGTPAKGYLFPPRNRIVSGLADVVVVVEAREKSGTLIELAVTSFLGPVCTPNRLNLKTLEREGYLLTMLHYIACKRNSEIITETFLRSKSCFLSAVLNTEKEFISFLSVFAHEGGEVLHCRCLYLLKAIEGEHRFDGVKNIITACHFELTEVTRSFGNTGFLCHISNRKYLVINCLRCAKFGGDIG